MVGKSCDGGDKNAAFYTPGTGVVTHRSTCALGILSGGASIPHDGELVLEAVFCVSASE